MALLHAGVDTSVIELWMGHEDPASTQAYLHTDMTIKEKALARVRPLDDRVAGRGASRRRTDRSIRTGQKTVAKSRLAGRARALTASSSLVQERARDPDRRFGQKRSGVFRKLVIWVWA